MVRHASPMLARSFARGTLSPTDLTMVTTETRFAAALVDPLAFSVMQTWDNAFRKFTTQSVVTLGALAFVLLYAFASIKTLFRANSTFAVPSLVAQWTGAVSRGGTVASVHALRIAQCGLAVLAHVTLGAHADFVFVAGGLVCALFVALRIGSSMCTFLTELNSEWGTGHRFTLAALYQESNAEHCYAGYITGTRQCHTELLGILGDSSTGLNRDGWRFQN